MLDKHALHLEWTNSLDTSSAADVLKRVLAYIEQVPDAEKRNFLTECVPSNVLFLPAAASLRQCLTAEQRLSLVLTQAKIRTPSDDLLEEAASVAHLTNGEPRKNFWNLAAKYVKRNGFLWDYAPNGIRNLVAPGWRTYRPPTPTNKKPREKLRRDSEPVVVQEPDWQVFLVQKPFEEVQAQAIKYLETVKPLWKRSLAARKLPSELLLHEHSEQIREMMLSDDRQSFYRWAVVQDGCPPTILKEFPAVLSGLPAHRRDEVWLEVLKVSAQKGMLHDLAPQSVREQLERKKYRSFLDAFDAIAPFDFSTYITFDARGTYSVLNEKDKALAASWTNGSTNEHELAKMISARAAEGVAKQFYEGLEHQVQDVAIQQLENRGTDWQTYDLLLDGKVPIDVKNARSPINNGAGYVEHTVPRFKQDRNQNEVRIAGVFSPYLTLEHLNSPEKIPNFWTVRDIIFLGETTQDKLNTLRAIFLSNALLVDITVGRDTNGVFVPPWVFDYPVRLYDREEAFKDSIAKLTAANAPEWQTLEHFKINPIPLYIAAGVPLPAKWQESLLDWQKNFITQFSHNADLRSSLPYLFLSLLTHFLSSLRDAPDGYSPKGYFRLLYPEASAPEYGRVEHVSFKQPLGIFDPLETIWSLCEAMEVLWEHRAQSRLHEFTQFKLDGRGLLRGRRGSQGELVTILAYCGGWIDGKGKCGHSPLIIGRHGTCPECGYLICPEAECGFCKKGCGQGLRRKEARAVGVQSASSLNPSVRRR